MKHVTARIKQYSGNTVTCDKIEQHDVRNWHALLQELHCRYPFDQSWTIEVELS